jgi:hypothetical protein
MGLGTVFACAPGKLTANAGKTDLNALSREATHSAIQAVTTNCKKCFTWFASSTTRRGTAATVQKTSQTAERYFVKNAAAEETLEVVKKAGRKRLVPDANATGAHTVFRRDSLTGKVTHYETYRPQANLRNPNPWESIKRFDNSGKIDQSHFNKVLKKEIYEPHVHDPSFPGGIRAPQSWEIP